MSASVTTPKITPATDGVIKYHVSHSFEPAPEFSTFEPLEHLRSRLFALGLIGEKDGVGYGNISQRLMASQSFFITATQTGKQATLDKSQYTFVYSYDFKSFTVFSQGEYKPSSEALSHAMIYEVHPEITTIIHIHSAALWKLMQSNKTLATNAEYGTAAMVEEIAALYKNINPFTHNAFVMKGHEDGIITFGRTLKEAEHALYHIIQTNLKS